MLRNNINYFYQNSENLSESCLLFENLDFNFYVGKTVVNQTLQQLVTKNSNFIQLVKYIFNHLIEIAPQNVVVLIADKKGTLLEKLQHGDSVFFLDSLNIKKGSSIISGQNNPIATALKERKITIYKGLPLGGTIDQNWTIITLPVNPMDLLGIITIIIQPITFLLI